MTLKKNKRRENYKIEALVVRSTSTTTMQNKAKNIPVNLGTDKIDNFAALILIKPIRRITFINWLLFQLGIINLIILTYFYMQENISFQATGWFPIPENIHWYYIFLILIIVRMLIVLITYSLTQHIKNFSLWTEKKKKNALHALVGINLFTLPINLPLIGGFYAYMKDGEIISNNWFLGTFRRILTENERDKLYQATVQNFLEKNETSKEIKEQLQNWSRENTKAMLEKYDDGSGFATEYISEQLKIQKDVLQLEDIKRVNAESIKIEDLAGQTAKDEQEFLPWIYEKSINGLNYFNPFVTDYKTCAIAWTLLLGTGFLIFAVSKSNFLSWNANEDIKKANAESIKKGNIEITPPPNIAPEPNCEPLNRGHYEFTLTQEQMNTPRHYSPEALKYMHDWKEEMSAGELRTNKIKLDTFEVFKNTINDLRTKQNILSNLSQNQPLDHHMQTQIYEAQDKLQNMTSLMSNSRNYIPAYANPLNFPIPNDYKWKQEKKNEILTKILKKHENQYAAMRTTFHEMTVEILTNL